METWSVPYCNFDELAKECHNNVERLLNTTMGKTLPLHYWYQGTVGYFKERLITGKGCFLLHSERKYNGTLQLVCSAASEQLIKEFGIGGFFLGGKDFNGLCSIMGGQEFYVVGSIIDEKEYVIHPPINLSRKELLVRTEDVECLRREYPEFFCAPVIVETPPDPTVRPAKISPKRITTHQKVIGIFTIKNYEGNSKFMIGNRLNALAIEKDLLATLSPKYSDEGIKPGVIRKLIRDAVASIKDNLIPD